MVLVSTLAFLGIGRVLVGERGGLMLLERLPFSSRFTSSSSVHLLAVGEALCSLHLISLSLLWLRPLVGLLATALSAAYSLLVYSGDEFPLDLPS